MFLNFRHNRTLSKNFEYHSSVPKNGNSTSSHMPQHA